MKLQGMTILYILIIIPMLIVISLTLSGYKSQLNNNLKYDSELTGAVNDAITAFELNSASQDYSNVSDNFTSLVEASVNVFSRSIATRLNMTNADESLMNRYFPLALFTGYSGYYIHSPTYSPIVVKNPNTGQAAFSSDADSKKILEKDEGSYFPDETSRSLQYTPVLLKHKNNDNTSDNSVKVTTSKDFNNNIKAKQEIDYSLKQMIPYTLELEKDNDNKILLNFTLDNYISFTGKINGITYNKSGFLLNNDTSIELKQGNTVIYNIKKLNNDLPIHHLTYFDEYVDDYLENELAKYDKSVDLKNQLLTLTVQDGSNESVSIVLNPKVYSEGYETYITDKKTKMTGQFAYQKQQLDAIKYYIKAANFSNFVYKNLSDYTENDIKEIDLSGEDAKYEKYFLKYDKKNQEKFFSTDKNVLDSNSTFNEVKRKAIRNSVQYDLIIATLNYNYLVSSSDFLLTLPVITDNDWDRLVENISFTAFLQGLSIGNNKKYNNYAIATSTMNEFVINPDTIYFSDINGFNQGDLASLEDNELYFHKIDCPDFLDYLSKNEKDANANDNDISTGAIGFKMSDWIYDAKWSKEESKYVFDHKNYSHFKCISNYTVKNNLNAQEKRILNKNLMSAVAAEKERSFKPNYVLEGGGHKSFKSSIGSKDLKISSVKSIEVAAKSKDVDRDEKEFTISISTGAKKSTFVIKGIVGDVFAYPYQTTDRDSGNYAQYKKYIDELIKKLGAKAKWNDISSITVSIKNTVTNEDVELANIKVIYI